MWFVYILLCADGSLYTGISTSSDRRFKEHLDGKGGNYTRSHKPIKQVYVEKVVDRSAALKREHTIKQLSKKEKEKLIFQSTV